MPNYGIDSQITAATGKTGDSSGWADAVNIVLAAFSSAGAAGGVHAYDPGDLLQLPFSGSIVLPESTNATWTVSGPLGTTKFQFFFFQISFTLGTVLRPTWTIPADRASLVAGRSFGYSFSGKHITMYIKTSGASAITFNRHVVPTTGTAITNVRLTRVLGVTV